MKHINFCLAYVLSTGICSFSSFSTSFITSPASHLRSTTKCRSRVYPSELRAANIDDVAGSQYQTVEKLKQLCHTCAIKSTSVAGLKLIDVDLLQVISESLDQTCLLTASTFGSFLLSSPLPARSVIFEGTNYCLSLLTVPCGIEVSLQNFDSSCLLLYKPLRGSGEMKTITDTGILTERLDGNNDMNKLNSEMLQKSGGPVRKFYSRETGSGSSVFLELAFTNLESSGDAKTVETATRQDSSERSFTLMQPPILELNDLFESSVENDVRNTELQRKSALFSANAKKYDILERIRFRVGGLSSELGDLVRRVLSSRQISGSILRKLGISHIKGILLYGPPGTGKTLIAREMARALNSREPILVNGPEIMDKYVGEAERNIRDLFKPAEDEWAIKGQESELHVIIFDEFDSVAKKRGSLSGDGSGVRDSCVNQLLSKLDGVEEMNNVLVICLTNRKDLIDSALLRPGRLEVHIEIKPPGREGREEILYILFKPIVLGGYASFDDAKKWCNVLAGRTYGYTGADLTGLIRNAASFAIERSLSGIQDNNDKEYNSKLSVEDKELLKVKKEENKISLEKSISIQWDDIERASKESQRDLKISKRARMKDFVTTKIESFPFLSKKKNAEKKKIVRREFKDILNTIDYDADILLEESEEENEEIKDVEPVKPAFQNIGGTLIF